MDAGLQSPAGPGRGFMVEQRLAAHPQVRKQRHKQDQDPHPAQPLRQRAIKQDAPRIQIQVRDHRRPRRGETRHRLEHGRHEAKPRLTEHVGQRAEDRAEQPPQTDHRDRLLAQDLLAGARPQDQKHDARRQGDSGRRHERKGRVSARVGLPERPLETETGQHGGCDKKQEDPEQPAEKAVIHQEVNSFTAALRASGATIA